MGKAIYLIFTFLIAKGLAESDSFEHGVGDGPKKTNCSCGWSNKNSGRIVNGVETDVNEYPFIAGIRTLFSSFIFCGGTLITDHHVLTAAHCPEQHPNDDLAVVLADHDNFDPTIAKSRQMINVKKIISHEDYDTDEITTDIALLVLEKKVTFSKIIGPACFPSLRKVDLVGKRVKLVGWGKLYTNGPPSGILKKVNLDVVPLQDCQNYYTGLNMATPSQLCTYRENKDSCQGDSGGPVLWLDPEINKFVLVGLVSYGDQCGQIDTPGINTDVYFHRKWIMAKIQESAPAHTCQKVS